jgi:hypothetical protein
MAWRICLPALSVTLVALGTFFAAMEPQYRRSFFVRDARLAMHRRHWNTWAEGPHGDGDRAKLCGNGRLQYVGEPVVVWIEQCAARFSHSPPAWCTVEWRAAVLEHSHLLPGDGAARVAAAMSRIAGSDGDGDGSVNKVTKSDDASRTAAVQERLPVAPTLPPHIQTVAGAEWDLSSTLVV